MTKLDPLERYKDLVVGKLKSDFKVTEPQNLYEPIEYILNLGGKRLRPVLALMACEAFGGRPKEALDAAMAIEVFHNFSLVHDDIMDDAPLRRGKKTVHEKWDINTGILSGDAMLIRSYQLFERYPPEVFKQLISLFSKTAIEVCEGQQYDVDFETRNDVTLSEYLKMIEFKTAVLVACAMKMGAVVAKASAKDADAIYEFGRNLGIAFQLQDDYLDAFGDPEKFGKQVGGDIIEGKKTILYLKAMELSSTESQSQLMELFTNDSFEAERKINDVKAIFQESGAVDFTKMAIQEYTDKAFSVLDGISVSDSDKAGLRKFGEWLMYRNI